MDYPLDSTRHSLHLIHTQATIANCFTRSYVLSRRLCVLPFWPALPTFRHFRLAHSFFFPLFVCCFRFRHFVVTSRPTPQRRRIHQRLFFLLLQQVTHNPHHVTHSRRDVLSGHWSGGPQLLVFDVFVDCNNNSTSTNSRKGRHSLLQP